MGCPRVLALTAVVFTASCGATAAFRCEADGDCVGGNTCVEGTCRAGDARGAGSSGAPASGSSVAGSLTSASSAAGTSSGAATSRSCPPDWHRCEMPWRVRVDVAGAAEDLVDFAVPVLVDPAAWGASAAALAPGRVVALNNAGQPLPLDEELGDPSAPGALWFGLPALPAGGSRTAWIYWGGVPAGGGGAARPWDGEFVGVWHLQGSAADAAGRLPDGVPSPGVTWVQGRLAGGLRLPGSEYIDVTRSAEVTRRGALTLTGWVNFTRFGATTWQNVIAACGPAGGNSAGYPYFFWITALGKPALWWTTAGGASEDVRAAGGTTTAIGQWRHWAVTRDDAMTVRFFVDGNPVGTPLSGQVAPSVAGECLLRLGADASATTHLSLVGILDEVRLSRVARSPAWIRAEHDAVAGVMVTVSAPQGW